MPAIAWYALAIAWASLSWLAACVPANAQIKAEAASRPPLTVGVFTSSRDDVCFDPGDVAAVTRLTLAERDRINAEGGVAGRRIDVRFFDDQRDQARTTALLREAISDSSMVALIGLTNSTRAKNAFDAAAADLKASGMPFLSDISVNSVFEPFPNVFSTRASQDDERLPVTTQFIRSMGFERAAFVGLGDGVASGAIADGLRRLLGSVPLVADHRLRLAGQNLDPAAVASMIASLKKEEPDIVVMSVGSARVGSILKEMMAAGSTPALFLTGRIDAIPPDIAKAYPNAMYQLAWDRLPEADNDRLRKLIAKDRPESWVFEGRRIAQAPGWAKGECKPRPEGAPLDPLESANLRAIGVGTQHADMVALVSDALKQADARVEPPELRRRIIEKLTTSYAAGRGAFKGRFENWSFHIASRAAVRTPFVVMLPQGLGRTQLAPLQFLRARDGSLRQVATLYVDIDMIRTYRVEDNEKTFHAEFYLSMRDLSTASIDRIEFTNAYLDPRTNGRQITIEQLHGGGKSDVFPSSMKIYKVTGRFVFEPELATYPFDTQRFSIDLQPKRGDAPFIVQPPPANLRDQVVGTDGWAQKLQYVGYEEDFVPVVDAFTHEPSVVPFYKASFVWMMKRQATDYYLRVVVPLAFIMIVAYLSIFISNAHFEAIVTIQVTALLSAVALYLSLPKLDSDAATISDRIFVFNYMLVSFMIVVSILRVNRVVVARKWLQATLGFVHISAIPLMVAAMAWYVHTLSIADR